MGFAMNRPGMWDAATSGGANLSSPTIAGPSTAEQVPVREVVRCQECQLVQFRTQSDLCRRCAKPLPSLLRFVAEEAQNAVAGAEAAGESLPFEEMPTDRAGRNRRITVGSRLK